MAIVYLGGQLLESREASISIDDRGFLFGDGVYEVVRARNGRLFEAAAHQERLERSLREIAIDPPASVGAGGMEDLCGELIRANGFGTGDATVYVQVTRGAAPRIHSFPAPYTPPTVFASASAFHAPIGLREQGAAAITRPDIRWSRCDIKSINLLPNVLAKQAAVEAGAFEAMLVRDGLLTEGASTNIFCVVDGSLRTHPLGDHILGGITRAVVLELAAEAGVGVIEEAVPEADLSAVDEIFATGTTTDVQPIVLVDTRPVGDGRPGPVTRLLQRGLERRLGA